MRKIAIFIALMALLLLCAAPAYAVPVLPHAFYGSVTVNGAPASDGTQVSATVDSGSVITNAQNPVTTVGGSYGIDSPYLLVQGDIPNGATITFYVNGVSTGQTATFEAGGGPTEKNLTVTISEEEGGVGGGAPPAVDTLETSLFGSTDTFPISATGKITEKITATSADGNLTVTVPKDTIALDKHGDPLSNLTSAVDVSPPSPPEDTHIIGLAYDFGPDGATFDPAITLTWSYDPDALPEGVAEDDLVVAYYDEDAGEWVELDSEVDTENNTITTSVGHFTTFAIIGTTKIAAFTLTLVDISPTEVAPGEEVTITVSVANTGTKEGSYTVVLEINERKETEKTVTVPVGESELVSFTATKEQPGKYNVMVGGLGGSFTVVAPSVTPEAPAAFSLSKLTVKPTEVESNEPVTVTVSVTNTGGSEGAYTVILKINGVKEAEKTVTVAAGKSRDISFAITREQVGSYTVEADGLSGSFTVVEAAPPAQGPKPPLEWPIIVGIIVGVTAVGLVIFFLLRRRSE